MKHFFVLLTYFHSSFLFTQTDSLELKEKSLVYPQNILTSGIYFNAIQNKGEPVFFINYLRLLDDRDRMNLNQKVINSRYFLVGMDVSSFGNPSINYTDLKVNYISDSTVGLLAIGQGTTNTSLKFGIENQHKLRYKKNRHNGIQMNNGCYGILGFSKTKYNYVELDKNLNSYINIESINQNGLINQPIIGTRNVSFLKIGFCAYFGFDYFIQINEHSYAFWGLAWNIAALSVKIKVNEEIPDDPNGIFIDKVKNISSEGTAFGIIRFGVAF